MSPPARRCGDQPVSAQGPKVGPRPGGTVANGHSGEVLRRLPERRFGAVLRVQSVWALIELGPSDGRPCRGRRGHGGVDPVVQTVR
jgi:hypothetical protein